MAEPSHYTAGLNGGAEARIPLVFIGLVADQLHFLECATFDGRRSVSCCRGRDSDLARARSAVIAVIRSLEAGQALRWDGQVVPTADG